MNIENFSTANLPGLADLGDTNKTERLSMSKELYLYITGSKSCISTAPPTWNSQENCLWHAKGSRVLSIEGNYGLSCLIKSYIGSELDII